MFSFLVRNEHNVWIPMAHLVVERENGEIIAEGLRHRIKQWYSGKWQPRYIMTDDSAIEQCAVRLTFPGLNAGEQEHRKLKSGAGLSKRQAASHGIYGMILNIMDAAKDVDNHAATAKSHFRNRRLAVSTKQYPEIGQLPVPVQKLLAIELDAVAECIAKGKEVPTGFDQNLRSWG
ncbi:hypothetical protein L211DRAFT_849142 [Terfezia boudieri ATCC MYA-4762]|uniref:Uncharacterized protein n=1 Tax=Terfezia boudieri ATCC MYA-4762 TaxID=1051890 RepID=A0A3N4LME4_9PEZI|nr:hypothetical protein L211DRAFT_849142 [Terfezia boudieri ATCC MYA-4762]